MFVCQQLIYIQMQKTGCSHIASMLARIFNGEQIGKHNAASDDLLRTNPYVISSIRNPWDWYLSLWTFGVQDNGKLMHNLTRRNFPAAFQSILQNPLKNHSALLQEMRKDIDVWRAVYDRSDNVASFRTWLKLMHDPSNSYALGEGYGQSAVAGLCGFMTYRYLYLCCRHADKLGDVSLFTNYAALEHFDAKNCYIDFFIRQESLEAQLCEAIEKVHTLSAEQKTMIYSAAKTNTSKKSLSISDYYDVESIELIRRREFLLIEKFGYQPPTIA